MIYTIVILNSVLILIKKKHSFGGKSYLPFDLFKYAAKFDGNFEVLKDKKYTATTFW